MKKPWLDLIIPLLPRRALSAWVGRLVHYPLPPLLAQRVVQCFARLYRINMAEAEFPLERYATIGELFIRRLRPGARPIGREPIHPVDALITESGTIEKLTLLQCKGKHYSLVELLRQPQLATDFEHGSFVTYYLCPTDYHRVHAPVDGTVLWSCHIPGERWPVNDWGLQTVDNLFCANERVVTLIHTPQGNVALVLVAATNVGNITMAYDHTITTTGQEKTRPITATSYQPPRPLQCGAELGIFHFGSTVIVLFTPGFLQFDPYRLRGCRVKMGMSLWES